MSKLTAQQMLAGFILGDSHKIPEKLLSKIVDSHEAYAAQFKNEDLPNGINMELLPSLLKYSDRYKISIQFWPDQTSVYISKADVELNSYGGSFEVVVTSAFEYLDRINKSKSKPTKP